MIGLFLGKTDFPKKILIQLKKRGIKYFIIDLTKKNIFKKDKYSYSINIGKFGSLVNFLMFLISFFICSKDRIFRLKSIKPQGLSLDNSFFSLTDK